MSWSGQVLQPHLPTPCSGQPGCLPQPSSQLLCSPVLPFQASAQPTTPGLTLQASPSPASVPQSRLLLPGDFMGTGRSSGTMGVHPKPVSTASTRAAPGAWAPSTQPWPSREGGQDQACSPITVGHNDLEAELESIQQQLQDYQTMKQNLSSCQRQARSLRRWLELSQEEPRPEDQEAEQQVQEELQEVRP